jgi:hypothetical protein
VKKAAASPVKAKAVKKVPAKKATTKKVAAQPTAADQVLKIINGSKKGVGISALMKKTGFNQKKIYNIVQRISKQTRENQESREKNLCRRLKIDKKINC